MLKKKTAQLQLFPWELPQQERPTPLDIDVDLLNIDSEYQANTPRNPRLVRDIGERFDIALFGRLRVARRKNGSLFVFDGRHRLMGARAAGRVTVPCDVYNVPDRAREIELFVDSNTRMRKVPQGMLFAAEVAAGQKDAVELNRLVSSAGLAIVDSNNVRQEFSTPKMTCIAALKSLYGTVQKSYARRATPVDHEQLSEALQLISKIAPADALVTEHMVLGMVWLMQNHPSIRMHTERLSKIGWQRLDLTARAIGPRPIMREAGEALLALIDWKRPRAQRLAPEVKLPAPPAWVFEAKGGVAAN